MSRRICLPLFTLLVACLATSAAAEVGKRTIGIHCQTPTPSVTIKIAKVWQVGDELWVISEIGGTGGIGLTVIGKATDSVKVETDNDKPVKHFVVGRTWNWWEGTPAEFIKSVDELEEQMEKDGKKIDAVLPIEPENN